MDIETGVPLPAKKAMASNVAKKAEYDNVLDTSPRPHTDKRVRIVLEDNAEIPPTGQFFSVNGRAYVLRSNEEAEVPIELLGVLNDAVMEVPIIQNDQIIGHRKRMRFPYRVIAKDI